jgi:hypothetical protein
LNGFGIAFFIFGITPPTFYSQKMLLPHDLFLLAIMRNLRGLAAGPSAATNRPSLALSLTASGSCCCNPVSPTSNVSLCALSINNLADSAAFLLLPASHFFFSPFNSSSASLRILSLSASDLDTSFFPIEYEPPVNNAPPILLHTATPLTTFLPILLTFFNNFMSESCSRHLFFYYINILIKFTKLDYFYPLSNS